MNEDQVIPILREMSQFGVAGLMGVLWVWERWLSRSREAQLNHTHDQLKRRDEELETLIRLVDRNARAFDRFAQMQQELHHLLETLHDELQRRQTP